MRSEEKNPLLSETQVEKALNKVKEVYALLMLESNQNDIESTLHQKIKASISKFQDIFPKELSSLPSLI